MEKEKIVADYFKGTQELVADKQYHSRLPDDLKHLYCYLRIPGHSILALVQGSDFEDSLQLVDVLCPCPVKTVLRKYRLYQSFPLIECEYDELLGIQPPFEDYEF